MGELFAILVSMVLVNNVVLVRFLGLCPFMGVSHRLETAIAMAFATTFVLTLSSLVAWLLDNLVLVPLGIGYLRIVTFIAVIAAVVQFTESLVSRVSPLMHQMFGLYLPLIASNCAVLGIALLNAAAMRTMLQAAFFAFGAAAGFSLVLILFAAARERIASADVPDVFKGAGIGLITAGLMSLAFMGFGGMVAGPGA